MMNVSWFRLYVVPFFIWSLCGLGIYFALQEGNLLHTSIGGIPVSEDISKSDVVIQEQQNGDIVFTALKAIPDLTSISLILTYDPTQVKLEPSDISSVFPANITRANEGQLLITLQQIWSLKEQQVILTIRPTWPSEHLTLSDVIAHFADSSAPLIVSSLN